MWKRFWLHDSDERIKALEAEIAQLKEENRLKQAAIDSLIESVKYWKRNVRLVPVRDSIDLHEHYRAVIGGIILPKDLK